MGLRTILTGNEETLRKQCREVTEFDSRLHTLLEDMAETLREAHGAGLAAPQVGVLRRVCLVAASGEPDAKPIEMINPRIVKTEGEQTGPEGCLSIPGKTGLVSRPFKVKVKAFDRHGKPFSVTAEDFEARAFCHEIDHLEGKLYTDIMERFMTTEELLEMDREAEEE